MVQLEKRCFGDTLSYLPRQLKYLLTRAKSSCFVETSNQIVRGFIIILYRIKSTISSIETLDVDPCFRGQGIGLRLLKAGEDEMRALGIQSVRLEVSMNNQAALHLYEKAGFKIAELLPNYYENLSFETRHAFRMIKNLGLSPCDAIFKAMEGAVETSSLHSEQAAFTMKDRETVCK